MPIRLCYIHLITSSLRKYQSLCNLTQSFSHSWCNQPCKAHRKSTPQSNYWIFPAKMHLSCHFPLNEKWFTIPGREKLSHHHWTTESKYHQFAKSPPVLKRRGGKTHQRSSPSCSSSLHKWSCHNSHAIPLAKLCGSNAIPSKSISPQRVRPFFPGNISFLGIVTKTGGGLELQAESRNFPREANARDSGPQWLSFVTIGEDSGEAVVVFPTLGCCASAWSDLALVVTLGERDYYWPDLNKIVN